MVIGDLGDHVVCLPTLARWHWDQWGLLTGARSLDEYIASLTKVATSRTVPSLLVAMDGDHLLGSASLLASDLPPRADLTPWLAQLFVEPTGRRDGVGAALVHAILDRARACGYDRVYLFTSGTLPEYYRRLGWRELERLEYLARERTVMDYDVRTLTPDVTTPPS